jgi:uncharacterized protein (TIGR00159 family)
MQSVSLSVLARGLRWQDAVDVLLLAILFSRLYIWLRRTVALQIALGLLTLVVASWIASHLGLILTSYLLSAVGAVATVVIVVVFQHEIRQGLSRVSPLRWMTERHEPRAAGNVAAVIARASFTLAARRKGALIVIPRRDSVAEHVSVGSVVDARLSADLIEAIFTSTSPLHDGAVVVANNRIWRAGAVLPLATEADDGGLGIGTRHRAALGLNESCDAVVVCVSEERGAVSLAREGQLERMRDEADLRRTLEGLGIGARSRGAAAARRPLRLGELWPHAAIFAGVVVAWAAMALDRSHAVARMVPLEIRGVSEHIAFDPPRFTSVAVELRSSERELELLAPDAVDAYIDLSGAGPGTRVFRVLTSAPPGIEVVSTMPTSIPMQLRPRGVTGAPPPASPPVGGSGMVGRPRTMR